MRGNAGFVFLSMTGISMAGVAVGCNAAKTRETLTLETTLPTTFAQLSNVVELRDGRVMFADTRTMLFLRADLNSGRVDTLGTRVDVLEPSGAASAYRFPGWVARLGGDSVALVDFGTLRTTVWNEQGQALGVLPIRPVASPAPVLLYDTVGHGYKIDYQAVLGGNEPGRPALPDSIPVLRINLKSGAVDTVANLAAPDYGEATFGEQRQMAAKVFGPNDFFGVLPDGTAWVARGRDNRVDWRSPSGAWTRGQPRTYDEVSVTQEDRDRVLAQVREQGKQRGVPEGIKIEYPFAATKPPFDYAMARPEGEVWLQRSRASHDEPVHYDVYDRRGAWQREVVFPGGASLAGFGKDGAVYALVKTEGDRRTVGRLRTR